MSQYHRGHKTVSNIGILSKKFVFFSCKVMQSRPTCELHFLSALAYPSSPALPSLPYRYSSRVKVADTASGKEESSDKICGSAAAPVSFKTDV